MKVEVSGDVALTLAVFGIDKVEILGLKEVLDEVLSSLTAREQRLLRLLFGIEGGVPLTHQQVAWEFDTTANWVHRWELMALQKLRDPLRSGKLRPFLGAICKPKANDG